MLLIHSVPLIQVTLLNHSSNYSSLSFTRSILPNYHLHIIPYERMIAYENHSFKRGCVKFGC
jgi:hypothetical protein